MIILDTNVISKLMKATPDQSVVTWVDHQISESLWTTSVSIFEIRYGLEILQESKRKETLQEAFERTIVQNLKERVLDFDKLAAQQAATIAATLRVSGHPIEIRDVQIAGIVAAHHATLATCNLRHFINTGISLINPYK